MVKGVLEELLDNTRELECHAKHGRAAIEVLIAGHLSQSRGNSPVALPLVHKSETELWLPVT